MINISKKSDIIIPFSRIGDEGWDVKTEKIVRSLLYSWGTDLNQIEFELKSDADLDELESRIECTLPQGLRLFYKRFGTAIGEDLQEFDMIGRLTDIWDVNAENYSGPDFSEEGLKYFSHLVTFSDHRGNGKVVCFHDETKEIYYFDHKNKPHITQIFNSIDDYMKGCLINCQIDLFDLEVGQTSVENWIEEIMIDKFGSHILKKIELI